MAADDAKDDARILETWNSFWGHLLLWRFHQDNPERWTARESRADWVVTSLALRPGARVADLACGDGLLDICLAARGYQVTAIDRIAPVLESARVEAETRGVAVEFVVADLRSYDLGAGLFEGALFLDTLGLMGREAELKLLRQLGPCLRPGARLALDWPREGSNAKWERQFCDGVLRAAASYERAARIQWIQVEFRRVDGRVIELHDPYELPDHRGIRRHIYTLEEVQALLQDTGYESREAAHYRSEGHHMLIAHPSASQG